MNKHPQWFEYIRLHIPTQQIDRLEVECDDPVEFYALINQWNRNDSKGEWKFWSPFDWRVNLHRKVHKQRNK